MPRSSSSVSIAATSGWWRSKAGRSERTRGRETKLCRGGGQLVAHSSELEKPHGSSTNTVRGPRVVTETFHRKGSVESRSEERRVGKDGVVRWSLQHLQYSNMM